MTTTIQTFKTIKKKEKKKTLEFSINSNELKSLEIFSFLLQHFYFLNTTVYTLSQHCHYLLSSFLTHRTASERDNYSLAGTSDQIMHTAQFPKGIFIHINT